VMSSRCLNDERERRGSSLLQVAGIAALERQQRSRAQTNPGLILAYLSRQFEL
jgi:hypothetical protein